VSSPAWSPDGRRIAYVSGNALFLYGRRSQLGNFAPSKILVVSAEGGTPVEVAGGNALNLSPIWPPDSRRLLLGVDDLLRAAAVGERRVGGGPDGALTAAPVRVIHRSSP